MLSHLIRLFSFCLISLTVLAAAAQDSPAQDRPAPTELAPADGEAAPNGTNAAPDAANNFVSAVQLLPDTTGGYLRAMDLPALCAAWDETTLSKISENPAMRPFWDAQTEAAQKELLDSGLKVGLRLQDLYDISSGEIVIGWMSHPDPKRPYSVCLLTDIRGRRNRADKALDTLDENMGIRKATRKDIQHQGQTIRLYTLPKAPGQFKIDQVAVTISDERLIAADRESTVQQLLDSLAGVADKKHLVDAADHAEIWNQVGKSEPAEIRWFARPLPLARIMREIAGADRGQRVDIVNLLERQGFAAIESAGGRVQVAFKDFDLKHHGYIYAPADPKSEERFKLAARMLDFPNAKPTPLPNWVDGEASSCLRLHWKMEDAFWAAETLVDDAFGSEIFRPTLKGIRDDVEGPQIDIAKDVIAHFDNQLFHVTDNIDSDSDRTLVAVRVKNVATVAKAVNKAMESEPDAQRLKEYPQHPIWKVVPQAEPVFEEGFPGGDFGFDSEFDDDEEADEDRPAPLLEQWAITVIEDPSMGVPGGGYLFFSSHTKQLVETVTRIRDQKKGEFEQQPDVQEVIKHLLNMGGEERSLMRINRTRKSWRVKYDLMRQGKLRESDSILGNLIRRAAEKSDEKLQDAEFNTNKLPPFATIEEFLLPAGSFMHTENNGWRLRGFLLRSEEQQ